jgi:hypothetical protein
LAELSEIPRADSVKRTPILAKVPQVIQKHPQRRRRMRLSLAEEALAWAVPEGSRGPTCHVLDPMVGFGTTYLAAVSLGLGHTIGADVDPVVQETWPLLPAESRTFFPEDARQTSFDRPGATVLLTSPPFPNSKTEGRSKMQEAINANKGLGDQGQNFRDMSDWRSKTAFVTSLAVILTTWRRGLLPLATVMVHIRDMVKRKKRVEVWRWVQEGMHQAGLVPYGRLRAPLGYRGPYNNWKKHPKRKVLDRRIELGVRYDRLECGHTKVRNNPQVVTEMAHCQDCPPDPEAIDIAEDWIVVAEVPL